MISPARRDHASIYNPPDGANALLEIDTRHATQAEREDAERAARLSVDAEMIERILHEGFDGPAWRYVSRELCKYGLAVIRSWLRSGRLFQELARRKRTVRGQIQDAITSDDHEDIVQEIVARAVRNFETKILPARLWNPRGGASVTTFFVGQCLIQAPNALVYWYRHSGRELEDGSADPDLLFARLPATERDVVREIEAREALQLIARPATRRIFALVAAGYTQLEIAEIMAMTPKAVERAIAKGRAQAQQGQASPRRKA